MNHPYTGAASYIYANECHYTPIDPRTKDPYGKRRSFVPSPPIRTSTSISRRSHDSGYSTNRTYTPARRSHHGDNSAGPPPRRALTQTAPRIPPRAPISNPLQQNPAAPASFLWVEAPEEPFPLPLPNLHPRRRSTLRSSSLPIHSRVASLPPPPSLRTSMATPYPLLMREIHPQVCSTSLPGHTRPTPPMKMTPYERDGNPLSQRRSTFVPYDRGPPEGKPQDSSGSVVRCEQLKRLICTSLCVGSLNGINLFLQLVKPLGDRKFDIFACCASADSLHLVFVSTTIPILDTLLSLLFCLLLMINPLQELNLTT
ncbi:hypothetical protein DFH08DRAFT_823645 [Mycena albidolilacea]|uniref:Uncharacterized protein n=1 Tax=Mycena albidolilacea TaxID=1033008 RepID=A0AAD6Z5R9_9AGAR|nr:hypothetical protein DFH08DRAFT_823645 [Mycena albidolilacea]